MSPKKEFGDFQTPLSLARRVVNLIKQDGLHVATVVEPTCGVGAFLEASAEGFGHFPHYWGFDVNPDYVKLSTNVLRRFDLAKVHVQQRDFYTFDWFQFLHEQPSPLLVIGNPPWITSAGMGVIGGNNLPEKSNFQGHDGFAARTGKANFDISEWMLIKLLEALQGTRAAIAVLCKTATARKVLRYAWLNQLDVGPSSLHLFDAASEFNVSVEACLLYTHTGTKATESTATIYSDFTFDRPLHTFGLFAGQLVSDIDAYRSFRDLDGLEYRQWRSGVKHDAAKIMEFTQENDHYVNGLGERYQLEDEVMFPLLKSSDLANERLRPKRFVLVTQKRVNEETKPLKWSAPKAWRYLLDHADQLDKRGSSIYKGRARFSIFGIGDYSFSPAKVAISGLYKNLKFRAIGQAHGMPIMVDDTCYFIPCNSMAEANFFAELLNTPSAQQFISALVFLDAKRPLTIDILKRIDLKRLAELLGQGSQAVEYLSSQAVNSFQQRLLIFEKKSGGYRVTKPTTPRRTRRQISRGR